jgi:hypothetical protein
MPAIPTTLTIEGLDADTFQRLESEAHRRGVAVSVLARTLLQQSVEATVHHDLDALAGTWSKEEAAAFDKATAETRRIDTEAWR